MLSDRQLKILQVIIDDFIRSNHPVGSRTLAKKKGIPLSSATIRNEMADLEELGFIEKTHASSGRIPSEKGYRFYVDHLLSPAKIDTVDIQKIKAIFEDKIFEIEEIIQKSASVLSELTEYTAIVLGPTFKETKLNRFQIVPLNDRTSVAIIVTDTGHIEHRVFTLPDSLDGSDIEKTVNILNERLTGLPLIQLQEKLEKEVHDLFRRYIDDYQTMFTAMIDVLNIPIEEKIYFGGKTNMLKQPEFQDIHKLQQILDVLEEEKFVAYILKSIPIGIQVKIGSEIEIQEMQNCSLITAAYRVGNKEVGKIAVLGPKRMHYSRVISVLNLLSNQLSSELTKLYLE